MDRTTFDALAGRRILAVGASSGSGRATALALVGAGAEVVFAARRIDKLQAAVDEAGAGHVVAIDVLDSGSVSRGVNKAAELLGGTIDGIVYSSGMSPLRPMAELTHEDWQQIFGVNAIGPNLVITSALPYLSDDAVVAVFSSDSSLQPRHSLTAYAAAKRALEAALEGWRTELLGGTRFLAVLLGPTMPTEFGDDYDPETVGATFVHWQRQGMRTALMHADDVANGLASCLGAMFAAPEFGMETILLRAPEHPQPEPQQ
ncbi:MAG: SDR family oxidoreductase [Acidimicrobiaceae bacterium]|nr:SDR family NAD(P)-dependent oxidoreductase [Acidimicrobiaceae bacterium]MYA73499.1 SDR family oxidoreductase [Acidimicrobiaceae bacterium]MYG54030.1 SDR family oxidoreductase [Acidimicrobiaceae bacterium]MYK00289.1 SDR family oxidoreductase [Acidimicrobiaceae bacterium]